MLFVSIRIRRLLTCHLSIGFFLSGTALAVDTGYIDAIEADVAEFTTNEFHPPVDSDWLGNVDSESTQLMDQDGFSDYLRNKSPGSFIFYKKLPGEYKVRLLKDYLATGDFDRIKQDIFKYTHEVKN
jgi:hypothetical protein